MNEIITYNEKFFDNIITITKELWENELNFDEEFKSFIYHFLVKYNLLNNNLSFIHYDNNVNAFLLASNKNDHNDSFNYLKDNIQSLSKDNQNKVIKYYEYLEFNHQQVLKKMTDNDIYIGLVASVKKHCGKELLEHLKEIAKSTFADIYLWTDETCNYLYYEKKNYQLISEYYVKFFDKDIKTFIYKFSFNNTK